MGELRLEIVTPDGRRFSAEDLDEVVFRRREREHEQGSEVAIFPLHGPMLVRIPCTPLRFLHGAEVRHLAVGGGFVEVKGQSILIITPRFADVGPDSDEARDEARELADRWLAQSGDFLRVMTGFTA